MFTRSRARVRQRFTTTKYSMYSVIGWGFDNIYPQLQESYIGASPIASRCTETFGDFVRGRGFTTDAQNNIVVSADGGTAIDLLEYIAINQYSVFRAVALHIGYNVFGEISSVNPLPVQYCRLGDPTRSNAGKVVVWSNWAGEDYRNEYDAETLDEYNPDRETVLAQMEAAGGFSNYKGQILFKHWGYSVYPTSFLDAATEDAAADGELGVLRNSNIRSGFNDTVIIKYNGVTESDKERDEIEDELLGSLGAESAGDPILMFKKTGEIEDGSDPIEVVPISSPNADKRYTVQEKSTRENIAGAANVPKALVPQFFDGGTAFKKDETLNAWNWYNAQTEKDRRRVERLFNEVFSHYKEDLPPFEIQSQEVITPQ